MKKILKWTAIIVGGLFGLLVLGIVLVLGVGWIRFNESYELDVPAVSIPTDEAAVARGKHLVNHVAHCGYCHGPDLAGDIIVDEPAAGLIVAPNLTAGQGGIGATYTNEDWVRTIRHGVNREGRGLFIMPSLFFHGLSEADLAAIVAYMQTIPAVDKELPKTRPGPLFLVLSATGAFKEETSAYLIDHEQPFQAAPPEAETAEYGAYLVQIGQCTACHGPELAGGQVTPSSPIGPNLTPGGELGDWSEDEFITAIRSGMEPSGRQLDTFMPWQYFGGMSDTELGALWAYLQSLPPDVVSGP